MMQRLPAAMVLLLLLLPLPARPAGPVELLADINTVPVDRGSSPFGFAPLGPRVYFSAFDDIHGRELWRTDGTAAGTRRVIDLCPGLCGASSQPVAVGESLFFVADERELWRTDGTVAGTRLVKRFPPGSGSITQPTAFGDRLFFTVRIASAGEELWVSDGTPEGTELWQDICPGTCSSQPRSLTRFGDALFFTADDRVHGPELWRTDGTREGTALVKDVCGGGCWSVIFELVPLERGLFFRALDREHGSEPWITDGTREGTILLGDLQAGERGSGPTGFTQIGGEVYFLTQGIFDGPRLWKTDGTPEGTRPAPEVVPVGLGGQTTWLTGAGSRLYFNRLVADDRQDVWSFEPATGQAARVGSQVGHVARLSRLGESFVFVRQAEDGEVSLAASDGVGSRTLVSFGPGGEINALEPLGDRLYFAASAGDGDLEPWTSDGTVAGTRALAEINLPRASSQPASLTAHAGRLFFTAETGEGGRRLWSIGSGGAGPGTPRVEGPEEQGFGETLSWGEHLYLVESGTGRLWAISGDSGPPVPLSEASRVRRLTALGDRVYFTTFGRGQELWATDGTAAATNLVLDVQPDWTDGCVFDPCFDFPGYPDQLTAAGGRLFFVASAAEESVPRLWVSDGTAAGSRAVSPPTLAVAEVVRLGAGVIVSAASEDGWELWTSDGTAAGTFRLAAVAALGGRSIARLTAAGSGAFFTLRGAADTELLGFTDGTAAGTRRVRLGEPHPPELAIGEMHPFRGRLFFTATTDALGAELWVSDGSDAGTLLLADLLPGPRGSTPSAFADLGSRLAFAADDGTTGHEPWLTDGTAAGTFRLADLAAGPRPSNPRSFTRLGDTVVFSADDGTVGQELFRFALEDAAPPCPADRLCLGGGRFLVEVEWTDFEGNHGPGRPIEVSSADSGIFWFFAPNNWELMVKILDACALNGRRWVFAAATTNVAYTLRVTEAATGEARVYRNSLGTNAPAITDTAAFPCR